MGLYTKFESQNCLTPFENYTILMINNYAIINQNKMVRCIWLYLIYFVALKSSSLGTTNAIMQGSPLIVLVIGHFFLDDKLTLVRGLSAFGLVAGIILNVIPTNVTSLQPKVIIFQQTFVSCGFPTSEVTYRYLLLLRESNIFTYETVYTREYFPQLHESVRRIVVTFLTEKSSLLITKRWIWR